MTRRVRFAPFVVAGVFAAGLLATAPPRAEAVEVPFGIPNVVSSTADAALSVFALDVDGDGDTDILSASYFDDKVAWYENDGSQSFTQHPITTATDGTRSVFAADVDSDGDIDVLSASSRDDKVAWYENDGSQNFTARIITTAADSAYSVYAVDVDGDGDTDILSASINDDTVAWYENDGSQSFTTLTITTAADGARSVFAWDVDSDGDMDVLSASLNDDTVAWYENDGSQNFTTRTVSAAADGAQSVFAADIDGDGDSDVVSASFNDNTVAWHENDGSQSFTAHTITIGANGARSVFATDVDSDGDVDVLSASINDDKVAWYENDGSQSFTTRIIALSADFANSVFAADVDSDGDMDVLSALRNDDTVAWYENETIHRSAVFPQQSVISTAADQARSVFAADVDGDGDTDTLAAALFDGVAWYENDGAQNFAIHTITTDDVAYSVFAVDVDGDGDIDVLSASNNGSKVTWYENDGAQSFAAHNITTAAIGAHCVFAADVDGDGDTDVLSASRSDFKVAWYENDGVQNFTTHTITTAANNAQSVFAADVDGDGDTDVLSASGIDDKIAWYENDGSENFTTHTISNAADGAFSVFAADVDSDGDTDVLSASDRDDKIAWYENDGSENFTIHTISTAADLARSVFAADVDGDGDTDVLSASAFDNKIAWYENDGSENFTTHTITTAADGALSVFAADVDGDGDTDVLFGDGTVAWYENRGGQLALPTTDVAAPRSVDGASESILRIDATHRGRGGDTDVELVTLDLLFEATAGVPLTTSEANALIENLHVYLDTGSGTFEAGTDTLVTTVATLTLTSGRQTVTFADGDANVRVALGAPGVYFAVVDLTANAQTQVPDNFRITHVTESSSTSEDADHDIPLSLEFASNLPSTVLEVNDPPAAMVDTAPATNEDVALAVAAPGVLANDNDGDDNDPLTAVLSSGPTNAAAFTLNADGSYSYTPAADFSGFDSFQYEASDGLAASGTVGVLLTIIPVADPPSLTVIDASGAVDTAIPLSVTAGLVDTDGSETLSITIAFVPSGATLSAGSDQGGGTWSLQASDLAGLAITPPSGSDADFTLGVQATATETANNDQASTALEPLAVTVDPPTSDLSVTLDDGGGVVIEGGMLTYTIAVTNLGPHDVVVATVSDTFPVELTGVSWTCVASASSTCGASGSGDISDSVDLLSGGTATYTVTSTAPGSETPPLSNTASVAVPAGVIDPVSANDSATVLTSVAFFVDGFESGDTSGWSNTVLAPAVPQTVPLTVANEAAAGEPRVYRGSFALAPALFDESEAAGETTRLFILRERTDAPYRFGIAVTRDAAGYRIRGWVPGGEDANQRLTRPVVLTERPLELSFEWIAASGPGARDGMLRLFVDGRLAASLDELEGR